MTVLPARARTSEVTKVLRPELAERLQKSVRFWVAASPPSPKMQPGIEVIDAGPWWLSRSRG